MATKKPTLTLAKDGAHKSRDADSTRADTGRGYSTRAKQAARRDGRELPIVRAKTKDPLIAATPAITTDANSDYRSKSTKPRGAGTPSAGSRGGGGGGRAADARPPRESRFKGPQKPHDGDTRRPYDGDTRRPRDGDSHKPRDDGTRGPHDGDTRRPRDGDSH
ncbi:MAG: hypothetical protein H7232_16495, partial [Aeromicrobium sp.]|nr:hypothetical protein [Burkholderiales bacterium]